MRKKGWLCLVGIGWLGVCPMPFQDVSAGVVGLPAQEYTQLANYLVLGKQLLTQAQQMQQLFQQVQWMVYNSKDLTSHPFTAISSDLMSLNTVLTQAQGLAYGMGQLNQQFAKMYPAYPASQNWINAYGTWNTNTLNTIKGTLAAAGLQGNSLMSEQQVMNQLRTMASSPMGQNQAIQLNAVLSTEVVSQLQKLRQLQIADMQSKAAYTGQIVQQDAAKQQSAANSFNTNTWSGDQRGW